VAVIRLSGPGTDAALRSLAGVLPPPRQAALRRLQHKDEVLDQALVLWFPGPASFTGEDVAELHIHGGRAVREGLFAALADLGLVPAGPGEFSRRAVENGKFDLTRAEGLADLVDAQTDAQRRQALRQYDGALADLYEGWRTRLARLLARAEAAIDFSDDGVGDEEFAAAAAGAAEIVQQIQQHMDDSRRGEALREGLRLTIVGPPNAGKSSLLNALAQRDAAIVSDIPGTTRDVITLRLDLGGYPVTVADTAGLHDSRDVIEAEGVRRAKAEAAQSDLTLLLLDGSAGDAPPDIRADLIVWNKRDLDWTQNRAGLCLSLKTGDGLNELIAALTEMVRERLETKDQTVALTRPRHRHALEAALAHLRHAQTAVQPELLAEDLRLGMRAIGCITGRVDVEELLDIVFRDFCIGK
jgi:tRNA modification GTPase